MEPQVRFHLDENVHGAIARGLGLRGIDTTTTKDAGLIGATDHEQIAFALSQGRVIVTHDDDLLKLHSQGTSHAGIVFCSARRLPIGRIVHRLAWIWRTRRPEDLRGRIEFL